MHLLTNSIFQSNNKGCATKAAEITNCNARRQFFCKIEKGDEQRGLAGN